MLEATAEGSVTLELLLPDNSSQKCTLKNVLETVLVFAKCALEESFTTVVLRPVRVKRRNCLSWFTQTCVGR